MRNLFKNAFKSFLKSKLTIFLVSFIVFVTITIFTILTNSLIAFRYSYDSVIKDNKLHDFTSKEKYDLSGELRFDKGTYENVDGKRVFTSGKTSREDFVKENFDRNSFSTDAQYIYLDYANGKTTDSNKVIKDGFLDVYEEEIKWRNQSYFGVDWKKVSTKIEKAKNVIIRLKKDDLIFGYDNKKVGKDVDNLIVQIIFPKNDFISFDILYKNGSFDKEELYANEFSHNEADYSSLGLANYIENKIKSEDYSWVSNNNFKIQIKDEKNELKAIYKSDDLTPFYEKGPWNTKEEFTHIKTKNKKDGFKNWLINKMNNDKYFSVDKNVEVYQIAPSSENSTGVFKTLLKEIPGENVENSTKQKIENWIFSNGLNSQIRENDPVLLSQINEKKIRLRTFIESFVIEAKRENYLNRINSLYSKLLDYRVSKSINIFDKTNNFKVVESNKNDKINKLKIFEGYKMPNQYSDQKMQNLINEQLEKNNVSTSEEKIVKTEKYYNLGIATSEDETKNSVAKIYKDKKFKWVAKWDETYTWKVILTGTTLTQIVTPKNTFVSDPSSYFAYVSPGYANQNNIEFIDPNKIMNNPEEVKKMVFDPKYIYDKYPKSTITMGNVKFLVIGSAIQPDYSFPIISSSHPIPNVGKEAIVFANTNGYLKVEDSYRGNERENYISFKWKDQFNLSESQKDTILYKSPKMENDQGELVETSIEGISKELMNWPKNIRIISKNDDTTEQVILAPHRTIFLAKLKNMIELISFMTITLLLISTIILIGIFIKKHINSNKKQFAILLANGYSKHQIALSNIIFSIIVMVIPSIIGYLIGFAFQIEFINLFQNYWTIPIKIETYSLISSILYVGLPFTIAVLFSYFISRWELRNSIVSILNDAGSKKTSFISNLFINLFSWINIKNKISISLFFANFSKMLMIIVVASISIITLSIGFTNIGKFSYAKNTSERMNNYNFAIHLVTPTNEGGLFKRLNSKNLGFDNKESTTEISKVLYEKARKPLANEPTWMVPNPSDQENSKKIRYLDNKIQFQSLLNTELGQGYSNTNPWESSAEPLMPEGQKLLSDKQRKIFNQYGITLTINEKFKNENWYKEIQNSKIGVPNAKSTGGLTSMNENYLKFVINTFKDITNNFESKEKYLPTLLTYKTVLMNPKDETYTYLDATFNGKNIAGNDEVDRIKIYGLKTNTEMVNIDHEKLKIIDSYSSSKYNEIPILINSYFSDIYEINKNDVIKMKVSNKANRNFAKKNEENYFKVLGIVESYDNSKIYTTQRFANKLLGLDKLRFNNEISEPFNGVFSKSSSPALLKSIPLYSESGYYPAVDVLNKTDALTTKIVDDIQKNGFEEQKEKIKNNLSYINLYSKSPYVAAYSTVDWSKMSQHAFDSTLDLSVKIIWIIETLAILFSIIIIIIVTMMIIADNKRFIATLKVMGYKTRNINKIFFKSIFPSLIFAILISIPIIFAILIAMKLLIVSFGSILIPLNMSGWEIITAIMITIALSGWVYYSSTKELKNQSMLEAFSN